MCTSTPALHAPARGDQAASSSQIQEFQGYLEGMRQDLTDAITEQQRKLPLDDSDEDAQHRQDWQHEILPRIWAIKQAGYQKLFNKVGNHKRKRQRFAQPSGASIGCPDQSWELLAYDLGWGKANLLCPKADPQLVSSCLNSHLQNLW